MIVKPSKRTVTWQLRVLMARRNIRSAAALARMMAEEAGYIINPSHLTRYTKDPPPQPSFELISAILTTLDADLNDLFEVKVETNPLSPQASQVQQPQPAKKRRGKALPETPFPVAKPVDSRMTAEKTAAAKVTPINKKVAQRKTDVETLAEEEIDNTISGPEAELFPDIFDEDNE